MVEAHTHFSWNARYRATLGGIQRMPTEEHILWCAHSQRYLYMGRTSGGGDHRQVPGSTCVESQRDFEAGQNPVIVLPGSPAHGDHRDGRSRRRDHCPIPPYPEFSFGAIVSEPEENAQVLPMMFLTVLRRHRVSLHLSGLVHRGAERNCMPMMDEEMRRWPCARTLARQMGCPPTRAPVESVKQCVRHGIEIIYPRHLPVD